MRRRDPLPNATKAFLAKNSYYGSLHQAMAMKTIRTGICVLAAFAVLAHGAVEPWSEAVLEMGAAVLLFVWAWNALTNNELKLIWNPLLWPLFGFWLVAGFQWAIGITLVPFLTHIELLKYS